MLCAFEINSKCCINKTCKGHHSTEIIKWIPITCFHCLYNKLYDSYVSFHPDRVAHVGKQSSAGSGTGTSLGTSGNGNTNHNSVGAGMNSSGSSINGIGNGNAGGVSGGGGSGAGSNNIGGIEKTRNALSTVPSKTTGWILHSSSIKNSVRGNLIIWICGAVLLLPTFL